MLNSFSLCVCVCVCACVYVCACVHTYVCVCVCDIARIPNLIAKWGLGRLILGGIYTTTFSCKNGVICLHFTHLFTRIRWKHICKTKTSESRDLSGDFENGARKNAHVNSKNDLKQIHEFKYTNLGLGTCRKGWQKSLIIILSRQICFFFITRSSATLHLDCDAMSIVGRGTTYHTCKLTSAH